jgi:hypothetical protein
MQNLSWIAIIGTREPTDEQKQKVIEVLDKLDPETHAVVSGCAYGIDAWALAEAKKRGIGTIGMLPWPSYNRDVQEHCDAVFTITNMSEEIRNSADASVHKYHPAPYRLSQGAFKLMMRNHTIIRWAEEVYAYPSPQGGGTAQGIRMAEDMGKLCHINI